jgi:hypothetical protein
VAADRISKETAELIALPPFDIETRSVKFLLNQPTVRDNIHKVPVNEPLMESLIEHGMKSPILTMPSYYPIAGSQRLRAMLEICHKHPDGWMFKTINVEVYKFQKEWWNMFYLWGDKEFRNKAIAIWFQMVELAWKSKYYEHKEDPSGKKMTDFEELGDQLKGWKHKKL